MAIVFSEKESVFFVGGQGTKVGGDNQVGGCTKAYWGDLKNPNKALSDIMGTNGEPISGAAAWNGSQTACTVTNNGSGKVRVTLASAFADCEVGHVANVNFADTYPNGRYEVIADGYDWIDIELFYGADNTCDAKVGGAFQGLEADFQSALDLTDAANYSVFILINANLTVSVAIDIDAGGGTHPSNTWKRIIGIDGDGIELVAGSYVTIDAQGGAHHVFKINNVSGIELRHIYAYNADANNYGFYFTATSAVYGLQLRDCKSTDCKWAVYSDTNNIKGLSIIGGYFEAEDYIINVIAGYGLYLGYAEFKAQSANYMLVTQSTGMNLIEHCILDGNGMGTDGIKCGSTNRVLVVHDNVIYDVVDCIREISSGMTLIEYNNIFVVTVGATGRAIDRNTGQILYSDYSCLWAIDDVTPSASGRWGGGSLPEHSIEENPLFVNAGGGDFRPRNPNVLRGGLPDIDDNPSQMGVILQKYQFARRARGANVGRLQIIR